MPYQRIRAGLYLLKQSSGSKKVDHSAIMDVGNRSGRFPDSYFRPVVIHQSPPSIRVVWLDEFGDYDEIYRIEDEVGAAKRLNQALENPRYDLLGNNCEHFALYVATGRRQSPQLQGFAIGVGLVALAYAATRAR